MTTKPGADVHDNAPYSPTALPHHAGSLSAALLTKASAADAAVAGSLVAVPASQRGELNELLRQQELWIHVDRIGGVYAGQPGAGVAELHQLTETDAERLDVHLMVDDPAAELSTLPRRVARVHLQCDSRQPGLASLVRHARRHAAEVWLAVYARDQHVDWSRLTGLEVDGLLVMLTPPGQPGHAANLNRLDAVRGACRHRLRVGVDGGVTIANIDQILTAGARHIVVGRGLIESASAGA